MLGANKGEVNVQLHLPSSGQRNHSRHVEFRIILLHVLRPVLLPELLDHRFHAFGSSHGKSSELRLNSPSISPNRRVLEDVLVPLRVQTLHGQEVALSASSTNQTGMEIVRPDILPITLILIWR
jgi:hypothetical protein